MFRAAWHFITDSWSSPKRARLLYVVLTAGFVVMGVTGAIKGDALVTALGVIFAFVAAAIALLAVRLAPVLGAPRQGSGPDA